MSQFMGESIREKSTSEKAPALIMGILAPSEFSAGVPKTVTWKHDKNLQVLAHLSSILLLQQIKEQRGPLLLTWINLTPAWISYYSHYKVQCTWKTFMIHQTFVWWALYTLLKFVKSLIRHLGLAIGNVRWFSWTLKVWDEIANYLSWPFLNFNSATDEVWEW